MAIIIVNKYKPIPLGDATLIYCGRGSALGNVFHITPTKTRDDVCDEYEDWFPAMIDYPSRKAVEMRSQISKILKAAETGDVHLQCFCAPKRCHVETIKKYVEIFI